VTVLVMPEEKVAIILRIYFDMPDHAQSC
jgi:hypothetical protein